MKRLLGIALVALVLAAPAAAEQGPTLNDLEDEVMCPTCHTTLDESNSPIAQRIKQFIRVRIAAGDTKTEIKEKLVAEFGPSVLAAPRTRGFDLLAWLLPLGGLVAGALVLGVLAFRWTRSRDDDSLGRRDPPLDPELERRLDAELRGFEA